MFVFNLQYSTLTTYLFTRRGSLNGEQPRKGVKPMPQVNRCLLLTSNFPYFHSELVRMCNCISSQLCTCILPLNSCTHEIHTCARLLCAFMFITFICRGVFSECTHPCTHTTHTHTHTHSLSLSLSLSLSHTQDLLMNAIHFSNLKFNVRADVPLSNAHLLLIANVI